MRKGIITKMPDGNNKSGTQESKIVVQPIENDKVEYEIIFPWYLRGETGKNLKVGDKVVFELFCDGTGYCVGRFDGTWNNTLGCVGTLFLGGRDVSDGTDYVALESKVKEALTLLKSHTHNVGQLLTAAPNGLETMNMDTGSAHVKARK